jgi:AGZA family xanthine/uracil permease-like MFS transporter
MATRGSTIEMSDVQVDREENETQFRFQQLLPSSKRIQKLIRPTFYQQEGWIVRFFEVLFQIRERDTTIKAEVYYGVIHFISCVYCLAVVPQQLQKAGYDSTKTLVSVALCSGVGSILAGLFSNLPFVLATPTVVSIFLSVFLQQESESPNQGSFAVIISGIFLILFGWRPLAKLVSNMIPLSIQTGTAIGIGLLTALSGSTEIGLVESGRYVILRVGKITPEICIAFAGVIYICIAISYHWKGAFCTAVIGCSLIWWIYQNDFPTSVAAMPDLQIFEWTLMSRTTMLTIDLIFLYILYLNGLIISLSNLGSLTRDDDTTPKSRWIYIFCGIMTMVAGFFTSAPILISPESSVGIKEGAKTGLSAIVAGILFILATFFGPVFDKIPAAGTSPVLIMIGVVLFQNVLRLDWKNVASAAPAFIVLFYIPFTYSIIQGKFTSK